MSALKTIHVFPSKESYEANKESVKDNDLSLVPLLDVFYPVGTIYQTANASFDPNIWGGNWRKIENRFLLGSGTRDVGTQGGEENVTLTINQMPSHQHDSGNLESSGTLGGLKDFQSSGAFAWHSSPPHNFGNTSQSQNQFQIANMYTSRNKWGNVGWTGGNAAHNNIPPFEVVNIWKRVS